MKTLTCTYLFADGHAVQVYEKQDRDAGPIEFVEITEKFTKASCGFTGRLILLRGAAAMADLCREAKQIIAQEAGFEHGSENSRRAGIAVGTLTLLMKSGPLYFHDFPNFISGPYHYQPGVKNNELFDPAMTYWGDRRVAKIIRQKVPAAA